MELFLPGNAVDSIEQCAISEVYRSAAADTGIDPEYQASGMLVLSGVTGEPDSEGHDEALREVRKHNAEAWCARHDFRLSKVRSHEIAPLLASDEAALWLPDVCQVRNPVYCRRW